VTASTGIIDAVSLLGLGHIFTANMTGNVVFLGFAAAGAPGFSISLSCTALFAFLLGAAAGGRMAQSVATRPTAHWVGWAFGVDGLLLLVAALMSLLLSLPGAKEKASVALYVVIGLTATAIGFRNATVRRLGMPDLTTTVLTLAVTGIAADSSLAGGNNPRWRRRIGAVLAMFMGAIVGALLLRHSYAAAFGVCAAASLGCSLATLRNLRQQP
jgi:uncharacterized membrane protein YoaK (UPF0700 family)